MSSLYVDDSVLSQTAEILARLAKIEFKKIVVDETVKNSEEFKSVSPKGDVPSLSGVGSGIDILKALANQNKNITPLNDAQKKEVDKWVVFIKDFTSLLSNTKDQKFIAKLHKFNKDLLPNTYFCGNNMTLVDVYFYNVFYPIINEWKDNERADFLNITRWFDFIQHHDGIESFRPVIEINKDVVVQAKPVKEKKEAPKAATVDSNQEPAQTKESKEEVKKNEPVKKEEKKPQGGGKGGKPAAKEEALPLDVSRLNIRVGKIVNVKKHESADTLYVEEIDVGEENKRQVVSGLVNFVPIEEMQNRMVVLLCNLKPANLKGVRSEAMVLAASNPEHTKVELLNPPTGSKIGERVTVDGFPGEHDAQLNPKHKVWETVQPDLKTNDDLVATYKGAALKTSAGVCTVKSIANGGIK